MNIYIYIEGAGDENDIELLPRQRPGFRSGIKNGKETRAGLSTGFRKFFQELYDIAGENHKIFLVMCGSRRDTYEDFKTAVESQPEAFNVLLIDAESPVDSNNTPWQHLINRKEDHPWILDAVNFENEQCHLMVQTMEAWFIADINALKKFYGDEFRDDRIHRGMAQYDSIEKVSKATLQVWLEAGTRRTEKKKYHKTNHAPKLLELLDVATVRQASPYCVHRRCWRSHRLFTTLQGIMES